MVQNSAVNDQIADSVALTQLAVLGESPMMASANLDMAASHALANAAHNMASHQQQSFAVMQTTTVQGIVGLFTALDKGRQV